MTKDTSASPDSADLDALLVHAQHWAEHDINVADQQAVEKLISAARAGDKAAVEQLQTAFHGPLQFGTAGLRAAIGPGESRMNSAVVARATAGLVAHLTQQRASTQDASDAEPLAIVIGHDARHGSAEFARQAAAVITASGNKALVMPPQVPTPLVAYAVSQLQADAGIMVTASHNPPADNGYKVYEGLTKAAVGLRADGAAERYVGVQIISPTDGQIATQIDAAPAACDLPRSYPDTDAAPQGTSASQAAVVSADPNLYCPVGEEIIDSYLADVIASLRALMPQPADEHQPRIVLTPMHGVGGDVATRALKAAGMTTIIPVSSQFQPDPDFPTVDFPNPEEAGALDEAIAVATKENADLIIALDPDADRCSIAIPANQADEQSDGDPAWTQLTGDQVGTLLAELFASQWTAQSSRSAVMANSIVSSRQLAAIAQHYGLSYQPTLTGFKYLGRIPQLLFAYEEALGYCPFPDSVGDKDGIATATVLATMLTQLRDEGEDFASELQRIARRDGTYRTTQVSFRVKRLEDRDQALTAMVQAPPQQIAGSDVTQLHNLSDGYQGLAPTAGLVFFTADNTRVIVRPSGTEPKLKCYIEVIDQSAQRLEEVSAAMRKIIGL